MIIGFDMDGVLASRPQIFKLNHVKGKYRVDIPFTEQWFWRLVMWFRQPSSVMIGKIKKMKEEGNTLILISGRLSFLEDVTVWWLTSKGLRKYFDSVIINLDNEQPHEFKAREIQRRKVKEFYEDEIFAAEYLKKHTQAKINLVVSNGEVIKQL